MARKGHTEEQIIAALQQAEAGAKTGRGLPETGHQPGDLPQLEEAVCGSGRSGASRTAAVAGGERPA